MRRHIAEIGLRHTRADIAMPFNVAFCLMILGLLLSGCGTTASHRARQYTQNWPAETADRLDKGVVQHGDSRLMVYIAYGPPAYGPVLMGNDRERWEYLGYEKPLPALPNLGKSAFCFATTNDVVFASPLKTSPSKRLRVEFDSQDTVCAIGLVDPLQPLHVRQLTSSDYRLPASVRTANVSTATP